MDVIRLQPVAGRNRGNPAADRVDVSQREPRHRGVRIRGPDRAVDGERCLDDRQQVGHDFVVAQLLRGLRDHGQIPLERPHFVVGNDEVGSLQARLGDVAAEHPLGHDLGLDRDPLATPHCLADEEAVVEGVEPGLETGREPQEPLTAKPELQLDGLAGPGIRHVTAGRELDRCRDHRPEVSKGELGARATGGE